MFKLITVATAAISFCALHVKAHPASPLAIAVVKEQFKNAKIVPDNLPTFAPTGLVSLNYTGFPNKTSVGVPLTQTIASKAPVAVYIRGTADAEATAKGPFNDTSTKYTVLIIDAGPPGTAGSSFILHWLANNWAYGENDDHTVTLNPPASSVVAYGGPAPPPGSGPHRYITLVYAQPASFKVPSTPAAGTSVEPFDLQTYKSESGLGDAIAGTYFTVQEGTATVSVAATTAVDSTTLPQYTPTSTSNATHTGAAQVNVPEGVGFSLVSLLLGILLA